MDKTPPKITCLKEKDAPPSTPNRKTPVKRGLTPPTASPLVKAMHPLTIRSPETRGVIRPIPRHAVTGVSFSAAEVVANVTAKVAADLPDVVAEEHENNNAPEESEGALVIDDCPVEPKKARGGDPCNCVECNCCIYCKGERGADGQDCDCLVANKCSCCRGCLCLSKLKKSGPVEGTTAAAAILPKSPQGVSLRVVAVS